MTEIVTGLLINKGEQYYTDLKEVLSLMGDSCKDYNWLITNYACYPLSANNRELFSGDPVVISGDELMKALEEDNFQWVWGVISAVSKDYEEKAVLSAGIPYADGNSAIWTNPVKIQHPMADIEIIAWDSSATVVIAKDDELIRRIKDIKPEAIGLEEYNGSN